MMSNCQQLTLKPPLVTDRLPWPEEQKIISGQLAVSVPDYSDLYNRPIRGRWMDRAEEIFITRADKRGSNRLCE